MYNFRWNEEKQLLWLTNTNRTGVCEKSCMFWKFSCSIYYDKIATKQQLIHLNIELKKTVEIKEVDGGRQQPVETGCGECSLINR